MSIHPRDILFYGGGAALERFGTWCRRTAPINRRGEDVVETFSRTGTAYYMGKDGLYHLAEANAPRPHAIASAGDGVLDKLTLLLEDARTNVLHRSSEFNETTTWSAPGHFIRTARTSIIDGQTAYEHEQDGGDVRGQVRGTFTGSSETAYLIVENVDATSTFLNVFNGTAGSTVATAILTWATGVVTLDYGSGTVFGWKLLDEGPNDGEVYLFGIVFSSTAGQSRHFRVFPTGNDDSVSTILHHAQLEESGGFSSPIVTALASANRSAETLSFPFWTPPQAMTVYAKFIERGTTRTGGSNPTVVNIGGATDPRLGIMVESSGNDYAVFHNRATGENRTAALATQPAIGDTVELLGRFHDNGSVQLSQSLNGGVTEETAQTSALTPLPTWGTNQLWINSRAGNGDGLAAFEAIIVARGSGHSLNDFRNILP